MKKIVFRILSILMGLFVFSLFGSIAGMELSLLGMLILSLLLIVISPEKIKLKRLNIGVSLYLLFTVYCVVTEFFQWGAEAALVAGKITRFSLVLVVLTFVNKQVYSNEFKNKIAMLFLIQMFWISLFSLIQANTGLLLGSDWKFHFIPFSESIYRVQGFFSNTMTYSYVFGMLFSMLFGVYLSRLNNRKYQRILGIILILQGTALVLTLTRGLWIAMYFAILVMLAIKHRGKVIKPLMLQIILFLIIIFSLPSIRSRLVTQLNLKNVSIATRIELLNAYYGVFKENPILGAGVANIEKKIAGEYIKQSAVIRNVNHAHNNLLNIMATKGLIGLILWFLAGAYFMFNTIFEAIHCKESKFKSMLLLGCVGSQIVFHVGGLTESTFLDSEVIYCYVFVLSLFLSIRSGLPKLS